MTICDITGMFKLDPFEGSTVESFNFIKSQDGQSELAYISIMTDAGNAGTTLQALAAKLGSSGNQQTGSAMNGFGAEYQTTTTTWLNGDGSQQVILTTPCKRLDAMCLEYRDKQLLEYQASKLTAAQRAQAGQF